MDIIKEIYEKLQDSRNGYQECSKSIPDENLKKITLELSQKRQAMMDELRTKAGEAGYQAETSGSVAAAVHRVFVDLKNLLTRGDRTLLHAK